MYAFLPGFGVGVMAITMIPSLFALILVRLISNDSSYYKPFSKDEIKQTLFEIIGIAVLGPVALFAAFIIIGILGPFALFLGIPIIIGLYALPLMLFWDMEFVIASFWGLVLLILQISIAVLL